jgi:hypothetical protein
MNWRSLIDSCPVEGQLYLVAIYADSDSPCSHWYDVAVYIDGRFDNEFLDDHNWVTHFCEIEPVGVGK